MTMDRATATPKQLHGADLLPQLLSPADVAALRLTSRTWQALVDGCLGTLHPYSVRGELFAFSTSPCLTYRSRFQTASVRHHPLCHAPPHGFRFIAGQFTALHTLAVDCVSKACTDFEGLRLMRHLRRLQLAQFSFSDQAFAHGLAHCRGLVALHLEGAQAPLLLGSLRHLSGLALQELVLQPQGYTCTPEDCAQGLPALASLHRLTQLLLLTALKPPCYAALGDAGGDDALQAPADGATVPVGGFGAGQQLCFDAAAVELLSDSLAQLRGLKVLRLTGMAAVPRALSGLTQLQELSLQRLHQLTSANVRQLTTLQQLTGLTVLLSAEALEQQQAAQQPEQPPALPPVVLQQQQPLDAAAWVGAAAPALAVAPPSPPPPPAGMLSFLERLSALRELVLGVATAANRISLTGSITQQLQRLQPGVSGSSSGWCSQGVSGRRFLVQEGAAVSAYACPTDSWSDLSSIQGLGHVSVEARSWHTATIRARYPCAEAAIASLMRWPPVAPLPAATSTAATSGWGTPAPPAVCSSSLRRCTGAVPTAGAVGVFINHPEHGSYVPSLPTQVLALSLQPSMAGLGQAQRQQTQTLLVQQARVLEGSHGLMQMPGGMGNWLLLRPFAPEARCHLLAQLRSSVHPERVLPVLGASASALTRLEMTVDQSWPQAVLASLGQLRQLPSLAVLKLDCGRQQPPDAMWQGLSTLHSLRWLCLRWLDALPLACIAPLTNLAALQLKNIDRPPGAAELAEALHGMQHLTALAIEGALLDAGGGDWLRDFVGLLRHGRWTSSWVEHLLCRQYHLRVMGSLTGALWMSTVLNANKLPEMLLSGALAGIAGTVFISSVAAALAQLLLNSHSSSSGSGGGGKGRRGSTRTATAPGGPSSQQRLMLQAPAAAGVSELSSRLWGLVSSSEGSDEQQQQRRRSSITAWLRHLLWLAAGGWLWLTAQWCFSAAVRLALWALASLLREYEDFVLVHWLLHAISDEAVQPVDSSSVQAPPVAELQADSRADSGSSSQATSTESDDQPGSPDGGSSIQVAPIDDPGAAFRRLRLLSLRRCTLSHSSNSLADRLWSLNYHTAQVAPGLASRLAALLLACVFWPLAVASALSRIAADSSSGKWRFAGGGSWGVGGGDGASSGHGSASSGSGSGSAAAAASCSSGHFGPKSRFAAWAWGWDLLCGLLGTAANQVEGAALSCGPVVAVASSLPELRVLDLTWLNLEPWELHGVVQLRHLHYLGLSRQQVGVVMSREAVFARNCSRGRHGRRGLGAGRGNVSAVQRQQAAATAASEQPGGGFVGSPAGAHSVGRGAAWLLAAAAFQARLWCWWVLGGGSGVARVDGDETSSGLCGWPDVVVLEAPSGVDEAIERELACCV